jgi:hypothetical protein
MRTINKGLKRIIFYFDLNNAHRPCKHIHKRLKLSFESRLYICNRVVFLVIIVVVCVCIVIGLVI